MLSNRQIITFIFSEMPTSGGSGKSVLNFTDYLKKNDYPYRITIQREKGAFLKIVYTFLFTKNIIVNGLTNFKSWPFVLLCALSSKIKIYLHEDETHLAAFSNGNKFKVWWLKKILRKNKVFFASEWQSKVYVNKFGLTNIGFWYENINPPIQIKKTDKIVIGMLGYISKRKGYQIFSNLAEAADANKFDFYWLGNKAEDINFKSLSKKVNWLGENQDVHGFLQQIDILFFSAEFDCFPLSIAEAIANNKKIILYKENGWADKLAGIKGVKVFNDYSDSCVLPLLNELINEDVDTAAYKNIFTTFASTNSFIQKVENEFKINI